MAGYKRRQFIVSVPFQSRFIAFRIILLTILALALWILVFYPLQLEMISDIVNGSGEATASGLPIPNGQVLLGIAAVFALMGGMALFESHRIAGPIYRFEKTMRAMIAGEFPQQVYLRQGDNFTHVVPVINELATRFEAAAKAERLLRETLAPRLDELHELCGQDGVLEQIRAQVEELRTQVRQAI